MNDKRASLLWSRLRAAESTWQRRTGWYDWVNEELRPEDVWFEYRQRDGLSCRSSPGTIGYNLNWVQCEVFSDNKKRRYIGLLFWDYYKTSFELFDLTIMTAVVDMKPTLTIIKSEKVDGEYSIACNKVEWMARIISLCSFVLLPIMICISQASLSERQECN